MAQIIKKFEDGGTTPKPKESGADHVENRTKLIEMLKVAFCEEMNAWYQYIIVAPFIKGPERKAIQDKLTEQAKDELEDHAYWLLERINRLGGGIKDIQSPDQWNKIAVHKYILPDKELTVYSALEQNVQAERDAIETYLAIEEFTRDIDPVTNLKIKEILADEEEHLQNLLEFIEDEKEID